MPLTSFPAKRSRLAPTTALGIAPAGILTEVTDHYLIDESVTAGATLRLLTRTRITPQYQDTLTGNTQRRLLIEVLDYSAAFATGQTAYAAGAVTAPFTEAQGVVVSSFTSPWVVLDTLYAAAGVAST